MGRGAHIGRSIPAVNDVIAKAAKLGHCHAGVPALLPTASSFRELLRQRDYICFWSSRWMGGLGVQIQSVTIGWQVYDLSRKAHLSVNYASFNVAMIGLITFAPLFFLALPAGVTADHNDRIALNHDGLLRRRARASWRRSWRRLRCSTSPRCRCCWRWR